MRAMNIFFLFALISMSYCLYDKSSKVIHLDSKSFKEKVTNGKGLWMVEFYAPWCGHCKSLAPEYDKVAKHFEGIVNIGAVDMDQHKDVGGPFGITGFPTLKFFAENKNSPIDYTGQRTSAAITDFILEQTKKAVQQRVSGGGSSSSSSSGRQRGKKEGGSANTEVEVVVLDDANFDENVMKSKDSWFVEFYAPWCGHCKNLEPEWKNLAGELKGLIKVAKVDATTSPTVAQRFGVSGYPSIKFFPAGFSEDASVVDYGGARDTASMAAWAKEISGKSGVLEITQLLSQEQFDEYCLNFNGVCIVVFLPHIYDSSKVEREEYLKILEESSLVTKGKPVSYLWSQGGDNYEFEEALQSGSAYPSVAAISMKKNVFATLRGVYSKQGFEQFLNNLLNSKESFSPIQKMPKIKTVKAWDGKDKKQVVVNDDI